MTETAIELGIEALKLGVPGLVCAPRSLHEIKDGKTVPRRDLAGASIPKLASNALRGTIIARPGTKLVVTDLSNIEGVGGAYLAGEQWKLDEYAAIFADETLPDMYVRSYARAFGVPVEAVDKAKRQLGKIQELACEYQGRVGAYVTFTMTYRMDLQEMADAVLPTLPPDVLAEAQDMLVWWKGKGLSTYGLPDDIWIACEALVQLWRKAHPATTSYWPELETAAKAAITHPGREYEARKLTFVKQGAWLRMIMPSGDSVCYPSAKIVDGKIKYQGVNQYTHQWCWIGTYGGKLFENATQKFARDVLFASLPRVKAAGYEVLLRAHDELICQAPDNDNFNATHLSSLVAVNDDWNIGLPLKAAGFEGYRYKKED